MQKKTLLSYLMGVQLFLSALITAAQKPTLSQGPQTKKIKGLVVVVIPQKSIPTPVAKKSVVKSKKVVKP
ncbi:MAG: hypothetical protein ACK4UP_08395, partial [Spirosomataceae bacterium]